MHSVDSARQYLTLAQTAIAQDDYAGADARYSSEFEALEAEMAKPSALHESGPVDWQRVQERSEALLREVSKDLRVACWLSWALYQNKSFTGLEAGLGMLANFCDERWKDIHPRKPKTRAAAIGWLMTRLEKALDADVPVSDQLALFRMIAGHLEKLDMVMTQHLAADAPLILPLRRRLNNMMKRVADNATQSGPVDSVVAQVKQVATQWLTDSASIDSDKEAQQALRALKENTLLLCTWWLRQKATDPRALRLNRMLSWLAINNVPQHNPERITEVRGVPGEKLKTYREQLGAAQYADLLVHLETSIARAPLWLDGQKMVWDCLAALGAEAAQRELEIYLALFLQRLPGIDELRFHDGTEFANAMTRAWIASHVMPHLEPADIGQLPASDTAPAWDIALLASRSSLRKGGLKLAVQELKQGLRNAQGGRARFFWKLAQARLCLLAKKNELAKVQLEALDMQLQQSGMASWEPELAVQVLQLLHNCYESSPQGQEVRERKEEIYRRLCHLDLEVVLE